MTDPNRKIKVLIADDSAFMRKVLGDIINSDPDLEVVATARNGEDALTKIQSLEPDVITLDVEMPVMDGLQALEILMDSNPRPVIMLSALTMESASVTMTALAKGAVDFVPKPSGSISLDIEKISQELIVKIKAAATSKIKTTATKHIKPLTLPPVPAVYPETAADLPLVFIGTSTGGPKALHEVMGALPSGLRAAVLIVQHMPAGFTNSLAQRLDSISGFRVKEAENADEIRPGQAYVAPGDFHLELGGSREQPQVVLTKAPPVNGHRPSVDVLFHSAAKYRGQKIGVIMTGMGSDGAKGLLAMKNAGAVTIGESIESCVVYGMPKSAKQLGAVDHEVTLSAIPAQIIRELRNNLK